MGRYVGILIIILLIASITIAVIDYRQIKSSGGECLRDVLTYSVKQLEKSNPDSIITCQCTKAQKGSTLVLTFDSAGNKKVINLNKQESSLEVNLSGLVVVK